MPTVYPDINRVAFFNQRWVQEELGVPVNFTQTSLEINAAFFMESGDPMIRDMSSLEHVLRSGINVAMATGDRDYRCNCEPLYIDF
jgi:hypothetical protein